MLINKLKKIEILKTIYYTFLSRNINKIEKKSRLICLKKSNFQLAKSSKIILHGTLMFSDNDINGSIRQSNLRMDKNSILEIKNFFSVYYGADIILFKGAKLKLGSWIF